MKSDHQVNAKSRNELDTMAENICAGENFRVFSLTGQTCDVLGFHDSFQPLDKIPAAKVAMPMSIGTHIFGHKQGITF